MIGRQSESLIIDGIATRVSVLGTGPPLLMFSPGGFDATLDKWSELGVYKKIDIMSYLTDHFTCILFDRRECGESGGRLEILDFVGMANQGRVLMEQLGYASIHVIGGCLGCAPAMAFANLHPNHTESLNLVWPVGGARYRIRNFERFAVHLGWVAEHGLEALINRALDSSVGFAKDSTLGPWGTSIRNDSELVNAIKSSDESAYNILVQASYRAMFNYDNALGPKPEELMQINLPVCIVPGDDSSHARSAAHFLDECIPRAQFLNLEVDAQNSDSVFAFFDGFYGH